MGYHCLLTQALGNGYIKGTCACISTIACAHVSTNKGNKYFVSKVRESLAVISVRICIYSDALETKFALLQLRDIVNTFALSHRCVHFV